MTTPGADQAAAKPWTADEIAAMFMTNKGYEKKSAPVTIGLLVTLAEAYLALLQENTDLRRALEKIRDEYRLNHTSKYCLKLAEEALARKETP